MKSFFRRLHPQGAHPGLSAEEDSTFRLHLVLLVGRQLLRRVLITSAIQSLMAVLLVTAGCPEVLGVTPLKKARRTREVSVGLYREPPPSLYGEPISRRFPAMGR